jgi:hypothetical protein
MSGDEETMRATPTSERILGAFGQLQEHIASYKDLLLAMGRMHGVDESNRELTEMLVGAEQLLEDVGRALAIRAGRSRQLQLYRHEVQAIESGIQVTRCVALHLNGARTPQASRWN